MSILVGCKILFRSLMTQTCADTVADPGFAETQSPDTNVASSQHFFIKCLNIKTQRSTYVISNINLKS